MPDPIVIRFATPADAQALLDHLEELIAEGDLFIPLAPGEWTLSLEQEEEMMREYAAAENAAFFVAEEGGELAGVLNLAAGKRAALAHNVELGMSVRRASRGKGIGRRLLAAALEWARANPVVSRITLHVYAENPARQLYREFGFVEEGCLRNFIHQHGRYHDNIVMGMLVGPDDAPEGRSE